MKKKNKKTEEFKSHFKTVKKTLSQKLQDIYGIVNMETTCNRSLACCKVAMPQMNYCEFSEIINEIWNKYSKSDKLRLICTSIEYFFRNEFEKWGMDSLVKPCMLLSDEGNCQCYNIRPLSCRLYGLWPSDVYNERVDKFANAYAGFLSREELPLNKQCPYVKRIDDSTPITKEIIDQMFNRLDEIDKSVGNFTNIQIQNKENYRTFHDWLLLKIFGEDWLISFTGFIIASNKTIMIDLIEQIKKSVIQKFSKNMPNIR